MKQFFSPAYQIAPQIIYTFIRVLIGAMMVYHGWEIFNAEQMRSYATWDQFKNNQSPLGMVYLGKGMELVGGILLAFGLFTRIACLLIIGTLGYIAFFVGHGKVWYDDQHPFLFVLFGLLFFCKGAGRFSIDALIFKTHYKFTTY